MARQFPEVAAKCPNRRPLVRHHDFVQFHNQHSTMNTFLINEVANSLMIDLRAFAGICEDLLFLATREHQALSGQGDYQPSEFYQKRKTLLPDIEALLRKFRDHRMAWQQIPVSEREGFTELKTLFQSIQG